MTYNLSGKRAVIIANAVNAAIKTDCDEIKMLVNDALSYEVSGFSGFSHSRWSGRKTMFNFDTGIFPAGFLYSIGSKLKTLGVNVSYAIAPAPKPLGPEIGTFDPMGFGFSERYDYQPETVRRLLRYKRMISKLSTGSGKSNCAILTYSTIRRNTLFITTRSALMYQMKDQFDACGFPAGVVGDGIWQPRKGINVAMVQTLASMLRSKDERQRKKAQSLLDQMEVLIGEEAHESGGDGYFIVANHCRNAHYRIALTATPFMKDDEEANMRLQAVFGSVGIEVSEKTLIDRNILAKPYFKYADSKKPEGLAYRAGWQDAVNVGIVHNKYRNMVNVYEAARMRDLGLPVISLIQREKHGHILREMMEKSGLRTAFLSGKSDQQERKEGLADLSKGNLDVLVGSTIFDVGVDVPSIGMVQLAGGTKDEVALRQRIGRALRAKKKGPNVAFVLDHNDVHNAHLKKHAFIRNHIVRSTPGFAEGIIPRGEDYPSLKDHL